LKRTRGEKVEKANTGTGSLPKYFTMKRSRKEIMGLRKGSR
jgi:hypothetical protein